VTEDVWGNGRAEKGQLILFREVRGPQSGDSDSKWKNHMAKGLEARENMTQRNPELESVLKHI
jgi:hypothetical protein